MRPFELHIAASLSDAVAYLARYGEETAVLAGGTDLIIRIRSGREIPARVLDVSRLGELRAIVVESAAVRIGALATHVAVAESAGVKAHAPLLAEACATIGSPQIRNMATLGGNIVTASRAGDSLPALLALDAELVLLSLKGERRVRMTEFFTGPRTTDRRRDELLGYVLVPTAGPHDRSLYLKLGLRKAHAISVASVAFRLRMDPAAPRCCLEAAIALGNLAPTVIRARAVEAAVAGRELDERTLDRAAEAVLGEISPRDDVRASADYRRAMVQELVRKGLRQLAEPARSGREGRPPR